MRRSHLLAFVSAAALSSVATVTSVSHAFQRRTPGASCVKAVSSDFWPIASASGYSNTNDTGRALQCGFPDSTAENKSSVSRVFVDVRDGDNTSGLTGTIQVTICSQPFFGTGVHCGASVFSPQNIVGQDLTVTVEGANLTDGWGPNFSSDYASVYVRLPKSSILYGFEAV
jgi:hypothetical protein